MNLYGQIDLGAFFGTEYRVIEGEEYICIPRRFNQSITLIKGSPTALFRLVENKARDEEGFTHTCYQYLPHSVVRVLPEADLVKMSQPVGKFIVYGAKEPEREPETAPGLGAASLASHPVKEEDIPL